jgi:hypothetical protein
VAVIDYPRVEHFSFQSNDSIWQGKIHLPPAYETNKNLPPIFLIDFTEQHFKLATDEFEKVIRGVDELDGIDALVVSLKDIANIDAEPDSFREHYELYRDMTAYVTEHYTSNTSRTFIGKGSESGVVLMSMFLEDGSNSVFSNFIGTDPSGLYANAIIEIVQGDNFPKDKSAKKLHFSFSTSNDRSRCMKIINLIEEAAYPWLQFESVEYPDSNYENTYPISFAAGMQYVFKN